MTTCAPHPRTPLPLIGQVQRYSWGKVGVASRIAPFLETVSPGDPLAEYWLGTHPKGSAIVVTPEGKRLSLLDFLSASTGLPFMLKVLSINPLFGLSIQSHPDAATAKVLHARDPNQYPDSSHKPEVGVALTPVTILYGFKSYTSFLSCIKPFPELAAVFGDVAWSKCGAGSSAIAEDVALRQAFSGCMSSEPGTIHRAISAILARFSNAQLVPEEISIIRTLIPQHGMEDAGLLAIFLMNIVRLTPGQAIYIGPNVPHAYLDGDLVECMACSDNVIRAGLTSKYKDVATLLETISFAAIEEPPIIHPSRIDRGCAFFNLPVAEFSLGVVKGPNAEGVVDTQKGAVVALCLDGSAIVRHRDSGASLSLGDGRAALLLEGSGEYECSVAGGQVFVAFAQST